MVVCVVGEPNTGKSSTMNALLGTHRVAVSSHPGRTKHYQTHNMTKGLMLCDCPGLVFPRLNVALPIQVGGGRAPTVVLYAAVHYSISVYAYYASACCLCLLPLPAASACCLCLLPMPAVLQYTTICRCVLGVGGEVLSRGTRLGPGECLHSFTRLGPDPDPDPDAYDVQGSRSTSRSRSRCRSGQLLRVVWSAAVCSLLRALRNRYLPPTLPPPSLPVCAQILFGSYPQPSLPLPSLCAVCTQILFGSYPIARCRDPYSVVRYLAEHIQPPLHVTLALRRVREGEDHQELQELEGEEEGPGAEADITSWSPLGKGEGAKDEAAELVENLQLEIDK